MGRRKNPQAKQEIADTACRCLLLYGYHATSYQLIAAQSGHSKSLVQYHFAKKELFISVFFKKLTVLIEDCLYALRPEFSSPFAASYCMGQVYFSFLILNEQLRRFTAEVISSREFTEELLLFNEDWCRSFFNVPPELAEQMTDTVTMAVGGSYELLYRSLKYHREVDACRIAQQVVAALMRCLGCDKPSCLHEVLEYRLEPETLQNITSKICAEFLKGVQEPSDIRRQPGERPALHPQPCN